MSHSIYDNEVTCLFIDGFKIETHSRSHLRKYDLISDNILHLVNNLCFLVDEKKEELPKKEWEFLDYTRLQLMNKYKDGMLYQHLLDVYGADALNFNAWKHFLHYQYWHITLKAITDMPAEFLEAYGTEWWKKFEDNIWYKIRGEKVTNDVVTAVNNRGDDYGQLPSAMAMELLFGVTAEA